MGATGLGYSLAEQFGLRIVECRPALVPLVFSPEDRDRWCDLTGVSAEVIATAGARPRRGTFREKMLVTHRGLSGPAVLQISSFWRAGEAIELDLAPGVNVTAPLLTRNARRDPAAAVQALHAVLPGRMAERWAAVNEPSDWTNASLAAMEQQIHAWRVNPAGTEGYAKAEVTAGGVDTSELDAKTMQSKKVPGLYFIGEVVDVTGWVGTTSNGPGPPEPARVARSSTTVVDIDKARAVESNQAGDIRVFGSGRRRPGVGGRAASWTSRGCVADCVCRAITGG